MQFRKQKYGSRGIRDFLIDVLAMANAPVDGSRHIVVGADVDESGLKSMHTIDVKDFSGKPSYQSLANEYIEPPLRIRYNPVTVDDNRVGVFEIGDCQDRPYMMRVDHCETLRRGDAYMRVNKNPIKLGRRQLRELFERKFRDSVSAGDIEIGFPGEIIHKDRTLTTCDLEKLPSAEAASKLKQIIEIHRNSRNSGSTSVMARLTHARLYGSDDPYINRTPDELMQELRQLRRQFRDHDNYFLYETNAERVQMTIYNQGDEAIVDASLTVSVPDHNCLYVANRLPKVLRRDGFADRSPDEIAAYPSVSRKDCTIQITTKIGDIPVGEPVPVFASPLRVCAGSDLRDERFGIRYSLHGQNLRSAAKGELRLAFQR